MDAIAAVSAPARRLEHCGTVMWWAVFLLVAASLGCAASAPAPPPAEAPGLPAAAPVSDEAPAPSTPLPAALPEPPPGAEGISLFGTPLVAPPIAPALRAAHEAELAAAFTRWQETPEDPDAMIWVGRRLAYLGRYREAIEFFSAGVERHPADARFLRHRGHRWITLRRFELAEKDLQRAAELVRGQEDQVEPDGQPNERNVPTSTLHTNVWYHLGLTRYFRGDFDGARQAFEEGLAASLNPDMQVAMRYWLYHAQRRLGRSTDARATLEPVAEGLDVIENVDYLRLLLLYKGHGEERELLERAGRGGSGSVSIGTAGYGVGAWRLENGRAAEGVELFRTVIAESSWASFGHIAAEVELVRLGLPPALAPGP